MNVILFVAVAIASLRFDFTDAAAAGQWTFEPGPNGPSKWKDDYPLCDPLLNTRQSPIELRGARMVHDPTLKPLVFKNFDSSPTEPFTMRNNGKSAIIDHLPSKDELAGGNLENTYILKQIHFHHGSSTSVGAEHTILGKRYPTELHFVHYNQKYGNFSNAMNSVDGLAVVGILLDDTGNHDNTAYSPITDNLHKVVNYESTVDISGFNMASLLPKHRHYFFYEGGLTTPPCTGSVLWFLFKDPVVLSKSQMSKFWLLLKSKANETAVPMLNTFRPVMPLGRRIIFSSDPEEGVPTLNKASGLQCGFLLFLVASTVSAFLSYN
ncbi:carbonic anhydrase 7-like [Tubulanus polymorphus]|uniref:carbonic anhydrase 7-like n=1 Tax=Tubulanus polymorphus TaxID=672921 RepID=UPI003DA1EC70